MSEETKIIKAPKRIWLQVGEDFVPGDVDFNTLSEVTWCQDHIGAFDVEYVLADRHDSLVSMNQTQATAVVVGKPIYQVWDVERLAWLDVQADYYAERLPSNRRIVYATPPAPIASTEEAPVLDKPAKVGGTRFGKGVKWRTVVDAAQRFYEYEVTPEKEAERIERARATIESIQRGDYATHPAAAQPARAEVLEARTYTTQPGEMVAGIALREIGSGEDWRHVLSCNPKWLHLLPNDLFPVGTILTLPPRKP